MQGLLVAGPQLLQQVVHGIRRKLRQSALQSGRQGYSQAKLDFTMSTD
jgi:hypothetical protein